MKIVNTEQALFSLEEALNLIAPKIPHKKLIEIRNEILDGTDKLFTHPLQGQEEPFLEHLGLGHRRLVVSHYKIIYRIIGEYIFITDIFDSRHNPEKMRG